MAIIILTSLSLILVGFSTRHALKYKGTATDLQSGKFYYTEEHEEVKVASAQSETSILFKDAQQKTIVTKTIDYTKSEIHPDFIQEDSRDGYLEAATTKDGITELKCRKTFKKKTESKILRIPEPAVIDGGFTYFVKANWEKLIAGGVIVFNFAVPSQLDYYTFRVSKIKENIVDGKKTVLFKMEPDQLILRAIVKPIMLTYNADTKRLMQYEGISNINDEHGKSYHVRITYLVTGP